MLQFSVAKYRNGFAVVYRNRDDSGQVTLRALSFDGQGNAGANAILADSSAAGTGLQLLQGLDGRLIMLWDEPGPPPDDGSINNFDRQLYVARLSCF